MDTVNIVRDERTNIYVHCKYYIVNPRVRDCILKVDIEVHFRVKSAKFGLIKLVQTIGNSREYFTKEGEFLLQNFDDTCWKAVHHRVNLWLVHTQDASTFPLISVDYGD